MFGHGTAIDDGFGVGWTLWQSTSRSRMNEGSPSPGTMGGRPSAPLVIIGLLPALDYAAQPSRPEFMAPRVPLTLSFVVSLLLVTSSIAAEPSRVVAFRADLWPGLEANESQLREVHFYTSKQAALSDPCLRTHESELSGFFADERGRLQLGEICGELVALMHPENHRTLSPRATNFVGAHETFHLVAQIFSGRAPSALAFDARPKTTPGSDRFFNDLAHALESRPGPEDGGFVAHIAQLYVSLAAEDKAVVDFYSTVEWPAEYYAYKVLANEDNAWGLETYIAVRREIGDEPAYLAAIPTGLELDRAFGTGKWEERVIKGETMFGMLSRLPAGAPTPPVWQVKITSWPLTC